MLAQVRSPGGAVSSALLSVGAHWIGSGAVCALRLTGEGVGERHARLDIAADGSFGLVDLGCSAGIRVNGERVVRAGPLGSAALIHIAHHEIRIASETSVPLPPQVLATANGTDSAGMRIPDAVGGMPSDEWLAVARRVHQHLIEQLDLRRRDVSNMSDSALRALAQSLLGPIVATEGLGSEHDPADLLRFVLDEALGLGPLEGLLRDDGIREIMVNGPGEIFIERDGATARAAVRFSGEPALRGIVERIVAPLGRRVDDSSPMVDARLPDGSRVNVVIPPLALRGTAVTIRRFGRTRLQPQDLLSFGALSGPMLDFLRVCVLQRRNLLVCGGTGCGKTTLLNVLSSLVPRSERIITIEDSAELAFDHPNLVVLETRPRNLEGRGEISVRDLVRNALRMRPDRIVIGECRGGETLDMLQAMNTGHDGSMTTVHANSPRELLSRLEVMVLMSGVDLPVTAIREQIASSIHIIVHQVRFACGARRITRITEVTGIAAGTIQTQDLFKFVPDAPDASGRSRGDFSGCGHVPQFYERLSASGVSPSIDAFADSTATRSWRSQ